MINHCGRTTDKARRRLLLKVLGVAAVPRLALSGAARVVSVRDFGALGHGTDDTEKIMAAARAAKESGSTLLFPFISGTTRYCFKEVNVAGLNVVAEPGVILEGPHASAARMFIVIGAPGARITSPTTLRNLVANGGGSMAAFLRAEYADDVQLIDCSASGFRNAADPNNGVCVFFDECLRPRVIGGRYGAAFYGLSFQNCTHPVARSVTTFSTGRHGILFYTEPGGTVVTDALAIGCHVSAYSVNGENGVGGIQGYGCRGVQVIGCTVNGDSSQRNEDTSAIRFRDCEAFYCEGYDVSQCMTGVLALHLGTYDGEPYNLDVRGNIGPGTAHDCGMYGINVAPGIPCDIKDAVVRNVADVANASGIQHNGIGIISGCHLFDMGCFGIATGAISKVYIIDNKLQNCGRNGKPAITTGGFAIVAGNVIADSNRVRTTTRAITVWNGKATIGPNSCSLRSRCGR